MGRVLQNSTELPVVNVVDGVTKIDFTAIHPQLHDVFGPLVTHEDPTHTCLYSIRLHVYHLISLSGITESSLDDRLRHHIYTSAIFYSFNIINPLRDPLSVLDLVYLF